MSLASPWLLPCGLNQVPAQCGMLSKEEAITRVLASLRVKQLRQLRQRVGHGQGLLQGHQAPTQQVELRGVERQQAQLLRPPRLGMMPTRGVIQTV